MRFLLIQIITKRKKTFFKIDSYTFQKSTEELKKLFIDEIFYQKFAAKNYEIPFKLFKEIKIADDGNYFYRCFSYYFYKNVNRHLEIRETPSSLSWNMLKNSIFFSKVMIILC